MLAIAAHGNAYLRAGRSCLQSIAWGHFIVKPLYILVARGCIPKREVQRHGAGECQCGHSDCGNDEQWRHGDGYGEGKLKGFLPEVGSRYSLAMRLPIERTAQIWWEVYPRFDFWGSFRNALGLSREATGHFCHGR